MKNLDIATQIGENIQEARKFAGFTQSYMASKLCITQQQYSRFENGVFELNYNQILTICKILDITPNDIFNIENI